MIQVDELFQLAQLGCACCVIFNVALGRPRHIHDRKTHAYHHTTQLLYTPVDCFPIAAAEGEVVVV